MGGEGYKRLKSLLFPELKIEDWYDPVWHLKHSIRDRGSISKVLKLREEEDKGIKLVEDGVIKFPFSITPYYLSLIDFEDNQDPLRRQVIPTVKELEEHEGELEDPLDEERLSVCPGVIHRYPDRVLWLVTEVCASYCRFCTRRRRVGYTRERSEKEYEQAIKWIEANKGIREVILSGGDPLLLSLDRLDRLLYSLRKIEHVRIIRIGTRVTVFLPYLISEELVELLSKYKPIYISTHFNHPRELTEESKEACERIVDRGIPMVNQTVLLSGINDCYYVIEELIWKLLEARVKPYYIMQVDKVKGVSHFRSSLKRGIEIMSLLRGRVSGLGIPFFVIDIPGGKGKIPLSPTYIRWEGGEIKSFYSLEGEEISISDGGAGVVCSRCICQGRIGALGVVQKDP